MIFITPWPVAGFTHQGVQKGGQNPLLPPPSYLGKGVVMYRHQGGERDGIWTVVAGGGMGRGGG